MNEYLYQRQIIAYHGCDESIAKQVFDKDEPLAPEEKDYHWLGQGIYFWEHGAERAYDWACENRENPAVIGAIIHLGNCFDLLDLQNTQILSEAWPRFQQAKAAAGEPIPHNEAPKNNPNREKLLHRRDCAVINWTIEQLEQADTPQYDSVRGVFQESEPVFEDSEIRLKSHIQSPSGIPLAFWAIFDHH